MPFPYQDNTIPRPRSFALAIQTADCVDLVERYQVSLKTLHKWKRQVEAERAAARKQSIAA